VKEHSRRPRPGSPAAGRREGRRAEILAAAASLFAERGFHGVSIDDIGSAAGMSGPGIYRRFAGKEAVLTDMLLDVSQRLLAGGSSRVVAASDAEAALDALLRWHITFALSQPDLITVQSRALANVAEPARRQIRRLQRLYVVGHRAGRAGAVGAAGTAMHRGPCRFRAAQLHAAQRKRAPGRVHGQALV
jgi:AcrR family transcriptional regulator